jgi:UDP-glucose 4-epimerase
MREHHLITGGAGFIGSHLSDRLLASGVAVSVADDFSLGTRGNVAHLSGRPDFRLWEGDLSREDEARRVFAEAVAAAGPIHQVWHLAANSDIAAGTTDPGIDFRRTLATTFHTLGAAREQGIRRLAFASTSAIYGERSDLLTEDSGPLLPISNYGASKLASEALISAGVESHLERAWIFRFPNVIGSRATHGAIYDFIGRLAGHPAALRVLGDGTQTKPYLHVEELVGAMLHIVERAHGRRNVFNIGPSDSGVSVSFMAEQAIARVRPGTPIAYTGGDRGWVGDVPRFRYSVQKLLDLGWVPRLSSAEAVVRAVDEVARDRKL